MRLEVLMERLRADTPRLITSLLHPGICVIGVRYMSAPQLGGICCEGGKTCTLSEAAVILKGKY
jgi:hypothetical protein